MSKKKFLRLNGKMTGPLRNRMFGFLESNGLTFEKTPSNEILAVSCLQHMKIKGSIHTTEGVVELYHALVGFKDHVHQQAKKAKAVKPTTTAKVDRQAFYLSPEWRKVRYVALKANDGRCELCGAGKHDGAILHVDHILPRSKFPLLELELTNLQILCEACNMGKGNRDDTDWRYQEPVEPSFEHRILTGK